MVDRLGHGGDADEFVPKLVQALAHKRVVQVAVGTAHTMAVTAGGALCTTGYGSCGRLGHSDNKNQNTPKVVEALDGIQVVQAAAGDLHSVVLSSCGKVSTFGHGARGRLGHGGQLNEALPRVVAWEH